MPPNGFRLPDSMKIYLIALLTFFFVSPTLSLGNTDTITWGGDNSRTGYQPNHNLDPKIVAGSTFGQIFKTKLPGNFGGLAAEQIYAQPLVYTGSDGVQYVYIATTQNNVYKLDAKTGAIVASRNLHVPFLQAELGNCVDINPLIGITATGVIDPTTGIWYVTAKTYNSEFQSGNFGPKNPPGRFNGRIWQHAIHTEDLSEARNWPVLLDGTVFRNNPNRMFIGGNQHSRPGALLVGDYVYTGYAGHCVQYNITGAIIGFHKTTGKIIEAFATEGGPEPNDIKGGGIWMSGGGLAYDGKGSMYFATGNGYASQLKADGNSVPGRSPPTALEEAAVNAKINEDGTLTVIDFFMPWEKVQLDGADKDLGTTPLELLPSDTFSCPNHRRIGVVTGKSGKTYWLNLDNLGGYQNGPNKLDDIIQLYQNENSVYAGAGVLPLSGGYIYVSVTQHPTHVFKFSCNSAGNAVFTKISDTPEKNAYILGTGHGTTTSLNGQEGTGLLWISDVEGENLRIYDPIPPETGGDINLLKSFNIPGVTKFSRPAFGDGRVYISTNQGYLYGFGSTYVPPLNCSSPYSFGDVAINNVSDPLTITCIAVVSTTITNISLNSTHFKISEAPPVPLGVDTGRGFQFFVVANPHSVGNLSADVIVETGNSTTPVTLKVNGRSMDPLLGISPPTISFAGIAGQPSEALSTLFWNYGDTVLSISNISFSLVSEKGPWTAPNTTADGKLQVGKFVFADLPDKVQPDSSIPISVAYRPDAPGNDAVYVKVFSDGGSKLLDVFGVAGTNPKAVIEFQSVDEAEWIPYKPETPFSFGTVYASQTRNLLFRITNGGGPNAVPLSITISKPPYGIPGIIGKANNVDLAEGTSIAAGKSQSAVLYCSVPNMQVNTPGYNGTTAWTLNTGDPTLGKQNIQFVCNAAAHQVGPLLANGTAQYGYVGCFKENNPGRQLATSVYSDEKNNTNDRCTTACYAANYTFAGTQYSQECWCGNAIPIQKDFDRDCNYGCTGNGNQTCGGDGYLYDTPHISLFADSTKFDGNTTSAPLEITPSMGAFIFIGCYAETGGKTLTEKTTSSLVMTVQVCAGFCSGYSFFGLEYASECYCGSSLYSGSTKVNSTQCDMTCKGSNSQYCGGASRMQIYEVGGKLGLPSNSTSVVSSTVGSTSSVFTSSAADTMSSESSKSASGVSTSSRTSVVTSTAVSSHSSMANTTSVLSTPASTVSASTRPSASMLTIVSSSSEITSTSAVLSTSKSTPPSSSTSKRSTPVSTISTLPTPTAALSCPASNSSTYTSTAGPTYLIECFIDRSGNDIGFVYVSNFKSCLAWCDAVEPCKGVSWIAGDGVEMPCYGKSGVGPPLKDNRIWGAVKVGIAPGSDVDMSSSALMVGSSASSSGAVASKGSSGSSSSGASSLFSSTPVIRTPTSPISSSSTVIRTVSAPDSISTAPSPPTPSSTALSCPTANSTTYISPTNSTYTIECFADHEGGDILPHALYVRHLEACILACDALTACVDVSFVLNSGGACYPKNTVGAAGPDARVLGARLVGGRGG